jgi:hypothetical protein
MRTSLVWAWTVAAKPTQAKPATATAVVSMVLSDLMSVSLCSWLLDLRLSLRREHILESRGSPRVR